jgi:hypothetical protein
MAVKDEDGTHEIDYTPIDRGSSLESINFSSEA